MRFNAPRPQGPRKRSVPRYFFHIHDGVAIRDEEGLDLPDAEAAWRLALSGARDIMSAQVRGGRLSLQPRIEVEDELGEPVLVLAFDEAVDIEC
jgi:hypothetical protein